MAQEQRRSMDLASVKKKLKDYEQLLQDYTLMRTKNKMKDSKAKSEEWWEVEEEYFTKELENNIVQHKVDEIIIRCKLETYKKKFQISFVVVQ
jgi:hypothetical protein